MWVVSYPLCTREAEQLAKASTETFKSTTCPLQVCCWASMSEAMLPTTCTGRCVFSLQASPPFHICHMCPLWSSKGSTLSSFRKFVFLVIFSVWVNVQKRNFGRSSDKPGSQKELTGVLMHQQAPWSPVCVLVLPSFWRPTWVSGHFLNSAVFRRPIMVFGSGDGEFVASLMAACCINILPRC